MSYFGNIKRIFVYYQVEIVFLHKIVEGGTDRSYGIQVARLAGVPTDLIRRAKEILGDIENDDDDIPTRVRTDSIMTPTGEFQLGLFDRNPGDLERALQAIDLDNTSPMDALMKLRELTELL